MNREELDKKKEQMMKHYENTLVADIFGEFSFIDHLLMTIDFLEYEIKDYRDKEMHNNWVLAGGVSKPRGELR
jgi:hypothetical protein|tara:strand:+ start:577 stop:795 length:219 start_codon:yes stop_codon:yes gene_type:complete